eukprot:scaffold318_cov110-Cylindrotheca_fusiformis.AAC.12
MLDRLLQFQQREGHCLVPHNHIEDDARLGRWLETQRRLKRTGKLGSRRIQILEEAGVAWDARDARWNQMLKLLLQYKDREGHTQVPQNHQEEGQNLGAWLTTQGVAKRGGHCLVPSKYIEDGESLGRWLSEQHRMKRDGKLTRRQMQLLDEDGVAWQPYDVKWNQMFKLLLQYKDREGHTQVPRYHQEEGQNLGYWLNTQREAERLCSLKLDRQDRLEKAGVVLDPRTQYWESKFRLLVQYKDREGHTQVPYNHQEEGQDLGIWLTAQRAAKRRGALKLDRQDRLEKAGVVWDPITHQWESMLDRLLQFQQREGHCLVPQDHTEDDARLGNWLATQRWLKRTGKLGSRRIQILEEAGVAWDAKDFRWNQMFKLLLQYKDREGHTQVPQNHQEEGQNLSIWLMAQRAAKRRGALKLDRQDRLEKAGVVLDPYTHQWESMLDRLLQFQQREGHSLVPQNHTEDDARLGNWLATQQRLKRTGKLGSRRIQILEEAGVAWDAKGFRWNQMFKLLLQYKDREGHTQVPRYHQEEGQNLGYWLNTQREAERLGSLKLDRQNRLEKAGVVLDPRTQNWESMFRLLVQYKDREGHTQVPHNHQEEGQNLGNWLKEQRRAKRSGFLKLDRQDRLEKAGVVFNDHKCD